MQLSSEYEDDATLVVLRRNDCPEDTHYLVQRAVAEGRDCRELGVSAHLANRLILTQVKRLLERHEYDSVQRWLNYAESLGLYLSREPLLELLTLASSSVPRHVPTIMNLRRLVSRG